MVEHTSSTQSWGIQWEKDLLFEVILGYIASLRPVLTILILILKITINFCYCYGAQLCYRVHDCNSKFNIKNLFCSQQETVECFPMLGAGYLQLMSVPDLCIALRDVTAFCLIKNWAKTQKFCQGLRLKFLTLAYYLCSRERNSSGTSF